MNSVLLIKLWGWIGCCCCCKQVNQPNVRGSCCKRLIEIYVASLGCGLGGLESKAANLFGYLAIFLVCSWCLFISIALCASSSSLLLFPRWFSSSSFLPGGDGLTMANHVVVSILNQLRSPSSRRWTGFVWGRCEFLLSPPSSPHRLLHFRSWPFS